MIKDNRRIQESLRKRYSLFIDLDGTIFEYEDDFHDMVKDETLRVKQGAAEEITKYHCNGYKIILVTARPESMLEITKKQLENANVIYDKLIMDCGAGPRILINDRETKFKTTAISIEVDRFNSLFLDGLDLEKYLNP